MALAALAAALGIGTAGAQIPDSFTNLKVLPSTIAKQDLVGEMRQFAGALGVRCTHCHVGDTPGSLEGVDFASDAKEEKRVARAMMKMVREINGTLLPAAGRKEPLAVACITCHRGIERPQTLTSLVLEVAARDGMAAAADRYRQLRQAHLGDGAYDFSPRTLNAAAEARAREASDLDGALALARLNLEFDPDEASTHGLMAQLLAQKGDRVAALSSLQRALELDPGNRFYKGLMQRLSASGEAD
jgi:tetratricopeptide (TPR) repeat protein